jgi:ATP-dependent Clp protease ATP-binding subunit ClpX
MIPELVGRVPVISTLDPLDVAALVSIMTKPRNALVKQYQKLFELEGCRLEFTEGALRLLAERALERDTGARALRGVTEDLMLDHMFDLPELKAQIGEEPVVVTEDVVLGRATLLEPKTRRRKESA